MWNIENLNSRKNTQTNTKPTVNQHLINSEVPSISPNQLYNTPCKVIDHQSLSPTNGFPFDFSSIYRHLSSEQQGQNRNLQDQDASLNKLYSNFKDRHISNSEEELAQYFKSNHSDVYKTIGSNKNVSYLNQQLNTNAIIIKKNLFSIFENAQNDSNNIKKEKDCTNYDKDYLISPPRFRPLNIKNKKIFECSGSSTFCTTYKKKKRFRKNIDQVKNLTCYYKQSNNWSKELIKEISHTVGLNENKVYKWLWDQKNKEIKKAKFIINK